MMVLVVLSHNILLKQEAASATKERIFSDFSSIFSSVGQKCSWKWSLSYFRIFDLNLNKDRCIRAHAHTYSHSRTQTGNKIAWTRQEGLSHISNAPTTDCLTHLLPNTCSRADFTRAYCTHIHTQHTQHRQTQHTRPHTQRHNTHVHTLFDTHTDMAPSDQRYTHWQPYTLRHIRTDTHTHIDTDTDRHPHTQRLTLTTHTHPAVVAAVVGARVHSLTHTDTTHAWSVHRGAMNMSVEHFAVVSLIALWVIVW